MELQQGRNLSKTKEKESVRQQCATSGHSTLYCNNCGAELSPSQELCPVCGTPTNPSTCSFCGAGLEEGDAFCAECGSPRAGIVCPDCGTHNFRSFCRKCNKPLNDNALLMRQRVMENPKYQQVAKLNSEMGQMEDYLTAFKKAVEEALAEAEADDAAWEAQQEAQGSGLSSEGEQLQAQYEELLKLMGQVPDPAAQLAAKLRVKSAPADPADRPSTKRRAMLKQKFYNAREVMAAYQAKAEEMKRALEALTPDAQMTPHEQRDFACACKVAIVTKTVIKGPDYWVCNFCGCWHNQPSECCEPWHGGTWVTDTVTVETKTFEVLD